MDRFLARSDIRAELGIPDHVKWEECNMLVHFLVSCREHTMSSTMMLLICCALVCMVCSHGWHVEAGLSRLVRESVMQNIVQGTDFAKIDHAKFILGEHI